ncbi:nucleotidyltransferase family protein [Actinoplanes subtropicus]|uniref:nucleotidyltransferase family protein n=1 Tax=Actinoplanes subtropicus TaxID=543632 RepID=UPI0004C38076|nr:nucleotidyltransferase family protein [Actinoplanes subtropicus]
MDHSTEGPSAAWHLLELVSVADPGTEMFGRAADLGGRIGDGGIDPDELLSQAARHALVPILADFLVQAELLTRMPHNVQRHLLGALYWNRHKTAEYVAEARSVAGALQRKGIRVACTKGVVCQQLLYDGRGTRHFGDVDLMVLPDQSAAAAETLFELGYVGGKRIDHRTGELVDIARSLKLTYQLYPDHLPHFFRVPGRAGIPYYMVDVAHSLTWFSSGWQIPMDEALAVRTEIDGLPALSTPYGFLFVLLHLFREAWFERTIREKDARLTQFADVWRFWHRRGRESADEIIEISGKYGIRPAVAWVAGHVDALYGSRLVDELRVRDLADDRWLRSAGAADGGYLAWDGDMRRRLCDRFTVELRHAPEPPFADAARVLR